MSNTSNDLPNGQIRFLDSYQPGIKDRTYQITIKQTVSAANAQVPDVTQQFVVSGPRFVLNASEIHAQFPPNGTSSQFAEVLPHVVLNKRLMPWERDVPGLSDSIPWVALMVFQDGELLGDATDPKTIIANYAQTMTVQALLAADPKVLKPELESNTLSADELAMNCQVITISNETFAEIVPTARELPYLTHAREVDTNGKVLLDMKDRGLFSVIVANRFPLPGDAAHGAKSIVHLVSLEGFGHLLGGVAPVQPTQAQVQLVSLASWTFSCLADPTQKFSGLIQNLAYETDGNWRPADSLLLRLPFPPSTAADPATVSAEERLTDGYVALGYHAQTGEDGFAWYRGPLTPAVSNTVPKSGSFETVAAAMIYDPGVGVFDHSLAAAWQCGRSLALADQTFATTLMRLRQTANAQLDQIATQGVTTPDLTPHVVHAQLAAIFAGGGIETLQRATNAGELPPPARAVNTLPAEAPAKTLRMLVAQPEVQAALASLLTDNLDAAAVAQWLGQIQLLYGVPFVHLVPDARMLPPESIRFFYFDANWIAALTDGALNVGLGSSRESTIQRSLAQQLEEMAAAAALSYRAKLLGQDVPNPSAGPTAGLLIRSALISGWPGLSVSGASAGGTVPLLRADRLAPNVMFCLFNGVPDTVTLAEPHEGLEFGVNDNGQIKTRLISAPTVTEGTDITISNPQNPTASLPTLRAGGSRVLNLNTDPDYPTPLAPTNPTDLLGTIAQALNKGTASIGPADFAVQMVKGPEEISFSPNPPAKP